MFKNIASTIITRFINALISFITIIILSRKFGAEGMGTIGLIVLGITIIVLINNFVGGSSLVYLVPRYNTYKLILLSYSWALISSISTTIILNLINLIPNNYTYHILLLSLLFSINSINQMIILGYEKITFYNIISLAQAIIMFISLIIFLNIIPQTSINTYVYALYCSYTLVTIWSFFSIRKFIIASKSLDKLTNLIKEIFKLGTIIQIANISQLFNYRLAYYFIDHFINRKALGIFNLSTQISEGVWNIPKSLSTVIYSKISNSNDKNYMINLTLSFFKISLIMTLIILSIIFIIPSYAFQLIFGNDFYEVKKIIILLSPGIIAISAGMILSNYFSGTGKPIYNTIGSVIGFIFTLILGLWLIPTHGLMGAALSTTISYVASSTYQIIIFYKLTNIKIKQLTFNKNDLTMVKYEIKKLFK
ncbi:MAG TPA: polysaccharide biosynthesis C-terminal domain-containing protein [Bacteroidales bacterium]|nr:polysaccharide biosynthesis C-terminal domain-containing protein [Bacteroidales bacterium]